MMEMKKHRVCVVTGTRAEYGLLRNLILKLIENERIDFTLVVTGTHLSEKYGNTQEEIQNDGITDYDKVEIPVENYDKASMGISAGMALTKFSEYFGQKSFDLLIMLGDRYEILSAGLAAYYIGIPIAHISGGDITEGAVDDAVRHCLTKISSIHFPGCAQSADRIIQMGEQPNTVFNVGEPGVENCLNTNLMSRKELADILEFQDVLNDYALVTFHPVTMENGTEKEQVYELIKAMDSIKGMSYIVTMANADAGGKAINDIWLEEGKKRSNWKVVTSLGVVRYLSAMKYCKLVLGNSSSGIVEAPAMGIPTVNIGDRQKGRMVAQSVICCTPEYKSIYESIQSALLGDYYNKYDNNVLPYGDGSTSKLIMEKILELLDKEDRICCKRFYDIK